VITKASHSTTPVSENTGIHRTASLRATIGVLILVAWGGCGNPPSANREDASRPDSAQHPISQAPSQPSLSVEQPIINGRTPPGPAPEGMVWIPGGQYWMGANDDAMPDARPVHLVTVDGFWMDETEVTNAQFAKFAEATGYLTVAERKPDAKDYPGADPAMLVPGSIVFTPTKQPVPLDNHMAWWRYVPGANWGHPEGPESDLKGRENHPAVHICWDDAVAYAKWAGKRLPTEAEWEFAARGGLDRKRFIWGDELLPKGKWQVNNWQGHFPNENICGDGFERTAPVRSFEPNGYGLYDMAGNVWEWCSDWYRPDYYAESAGQNPKGPASSFDPLEPTVPKRVQRGGSFLCSDLYCVRYLPGARGKGAPDSAASHVGFRCVQDAASSKK
jgi:formylglycine-generating enzyme